MDIMNGVRILTPGCYVRHFKWELLNDVERSRMPDMYKYRVLGIAEDCTTEGRLMVVYRTCYNGQKLYCREYNEFMSTVDTDKYPTVTQRYRFEIID